MNLRRKFLFVVLFVVSLTSLMAGGSYDVNFKQLNGSDFELNFECDDFQIGESIKGGKTYSKIEFGGGVVTSKKGFAELPYLNAAVQLENRNVDLEVVSTDYVEYQLEYPLLPSRGIIYRNQDP
ncbi:MAG: hypothetical protein KAS49_03320, partial [Candidatus Cloacimonetes bacterium]|nr:hypothetical protein [Candidatus Cloacimonadota bacterium]